MLDRVVGSHNPNNALERSLCQPAIFNPLENSMPIAILTGENQAYGIYLAFVVHVDGRNGCERLVRQALPNLRKEA
jgi:hypothetical protein